MNKRINKICILMSAILVLSAFPNISAGAVDSYEQIEDIIGSYEPIENPSTSPTEIPTINPIEYPTDPVESTNQSVSISQNASYETTGDTVEYKTDHLEIMPEPIESTEPTKINKSTEPQPTTPTNLPIYSEPTELCTIPPDRPPGWESTDPTNDIQVESEKPKPSIPTPQLIVTPHKTTISLASSKGSVYVKGTKQIKVTVKYARGRTTYRSLNMSVAKVSSGGKITGVKKGKAVIVIKNNGAVRHYTITVKNPKLNITNKTIKKGKTFSLRVIGKVGTPKFSSTNKKIAKVNSYGKVKARKKGNCYIKVKTNGMTLKCKVKVKQRK